MEWMHEKYVKRQNNEKREVHTEKRVLQGVALCCGMMQCVAVHCCAHSCHKYKVVKSHGMPYCSGSFFASKPYD